MRYDLQEQACWLLLTFESGLSTRIINDILVAWCRQMGRSLAEFFAAEPDEWETVCQLNAEISEKLAKAKEKLAGQAFLVEQLEQESIHVLPALDDNYPALLKQALKRNATPPSLTQLCIISLNMVRTSLAAMLVALTAWPTKRQPVRKDARQLYCHTVFVS
jgi:hypothetical protein